MKSVLASFTLFSTMLAACGSPMAQESQATNWMNAVPTRDIVVRQIRHLSDRQEFQLGSKFDATMRTGGGSLLEPLFLPKDNSSVSDYINRVGQRLVANSSRSNIKYTFTLNQSQTYSTVGGYVYLGTWEMRDVKNEAQLAAVLAHEIAHIEKKHTLNETARRGELNYLWLEGRGLFENVAWAISRDQQSYSSRENSVELEADELAFLNLRKSGYAADEMISFYSTVLLKRNEFNIERRIDFLKRLRVASDATGDGTDAAAYRKATGQ